MEFFHRPVLLDEVIKGLKIKKDGIYVDATLGAGGHFEAILKELDERGEGIGIDQDEEAVQNVSKKLTQSGIKAKYDLSFTLSIQFFFIFTKKKLAFFLCKVYNSFAGGEKWY